MEEKVFCPYCGPWNGHPRGVEMREDGNGCAEPERFGFSEQFWYYCPVCAAESPCKESREEARAAAQRRFPDISQIIWERDTAIQQLRDDYGVGFGEKKPLQKPLSAEDACGQDDPVWVELHVPHSEPFIADVVIASDFKRAELHTIDKSSAKMWAASYNDTWRCWLNKPTPEERAAAAWNGAAAQEGGTKACGSNTF